MDECEPLSSALSATTATPAVAAVDGAFLDVSVESTEMNGAAGNSDAAALPPSSSPPATASTKNKKRRTILPPPIDADEAERRKLFYAELRRHRRAFGIVGPRVSTHEPEHEDDTSSNSSCTDRQQTDQPDDPPTDATATNDDEHTHATALFMETMASDFGPIEKDDPAFMRSFPKTFVSWTAFDAALERFTRGTFQLLRTHATQATVNRNKGTLKYLSTQVIPGTFIGHFYPERFAWYKKVLVCAICRATSARSKQQQQLARRRGPMAKDTDAKVTAHLQPEADTEAENSSSRPKRFVIDVSWTGAHNHRCDADALAAFTHGASRLDDPVLLSLVRKMRHDGKEPRDVKRFIYECTGRKCSTKDVHEMYQRMGDHDISDDSDGDDDGAAAAAAAVAANDAALTLFGDEPSHALTTCTITTGHARSSATAAASASSASNPLAIEFDVNSGRLDTPTQIASAPERTLTGLQLSIARLAHTLTPHEQADLADTLQSAVTAWTTKRKRAAATAAAVAMSTPTFQFPSLSPHMANAFDYRRYDDVGTDLLMGLDTPGTASVFGATGSGIGTGSSTAGAARATAAQKRRRPS